MCRKMDFIGDAFLFVARLLEVLCWAFVRSLEAIGTSLVVSYRSRFFAASGGAVHFFNTLQKQAIYAGIYILAL